jgi:tRNA U34 5-carboxymethylaminomethyl modifying enzyme MnmG/GidA
MVREKKARIEELSALLAATRLAPTKAVNARLAAGGLEPIKNPVTLAELLRRPHVGLADISALDERIGPSMRGLLRSSWI